MEDERRPEGKRRVRVKRPNERRSERSGRWLLSRYVLRPPLVIRPQPVPFPSGPVPGANEWSEYEERTERRKK